MLEGWSIDSYKNLFGQMIKDRRESLTKSVNNLQIFGHLR